MDYKYYVSQLDIKIYCLLNDALQRYYKIKFKDKKDILFSSEIELNNYLITELRKLKINKIYAKLNIIKEFIN